MVQRDSHHHGNSDVESEIMVAVSYADGIITIDLKDLQGNAPELKMSHEQVMHFIIVSDDLKQYYHGHPTEQGNGVYTLKKKLKDDSYKVFVDISPAQLAYSVSPIELPVGSIHHGDMQNELSVDHELTKTIDGHTVELNATSFKAGQDISLQFDTKDNTPEPYLGALGHVVIVDEHAEKYIHVHPSSPDRTQFDAVLQNPGKYMLWAEFRFNGNVSVYPYVIEVS